MNFLFPKSDRLTSEKEISSLFRSKQKFVMYPLRFQWEIKTEPGIKVLIGCPKKNIKKAPHRNLIKRRIREAYRLHNHDLKKTCEQEQIGINIAIIHIGNEITNFDVIEDKLNRGLEKTINQLQKDE